MHREDMNEDEHRSISINLLRCAPEARITSNGRFDWEEYLHWCFLSFCWITTVEAKHAAPWHTRLKAERSSCRLQAAALQDHVYAWVCILKVNLWEPSFHCAVSKQSTEWDANSRFNTLIFCRIYISAENHRERSGSMSNPSTHASSNVWGGSS